MILTARPAKPPAFAAKALEELGYENVASLQGASATERNGFPFESRAHSTTRSAAANPAISYPEVGEEGQLRLLDARFAHRRRRPGSPASLYLAAAASARSGSSTTTPSTRRTFSARSSTPPTARRVEAEWRSARSRRSTPDVTVKGLQGAAVVENVRPHPRLGLDVIVDGATTSPLATSSRRLRLARHPGRPRLDLPLEGRRPCSSRRRAVLPLPLRSRLRRARPELPEAAYSACSRHRRSCRRTRRSSWRSASRALVGRIPSSTPRDAVTRSRAPATRLPGLRRPPDHHRLHRLSRVLRRPRPGGAVIRSYPPTLRTRSRRA